MAAKAKDVVSRQVIPLLLVSRQIRNALAAIVEP